MPAPRTSGSKTYAMSSAPWPPRWNAYPKRWPRKLRLSPLGSDPDAFRTGFADADVLRQMTVLAAYDDIVGGTRSFAKGMDGTQTGDPDKAAAIDAALKAKITPLSAATGVDAIDAVRAHSEQLFKDMAVWESVRRATAVEA